MPIKSLPEPKLDAALSAIADGAPVAWSDIEGGGTDIHQLEILRLLDDVAKAYRTDESPALPAQREMLLRWGTLEAECLIGEGSYGKVYKAFDPWLGRSVALKLFRATGDAGAGLDEARRLARVRHRNVLSVYGCGIHDGRAGLWSELIDGRTLAASVVDDGAFAAEQSLHIGRDLAQALAMVHAAGLVHGDVKAENVMRERGGRVVLMDFGAGGEARLLASQRVISGTPRYLPPEVLDGAPLSIQSDIYALGVLLFFMLSGQYPYADIDAAALRAAQRTGTRLELRSLRPELDQALCALVEQCIATDPAQRPASAHALGTNLSEIMQALAPQAPSERRLQWAALLAAFIALFAVGAMLAWPHLFPSPWESTVKFLRVESSGNVELDANSTLRVGDRLRMTVRSTRDTYLYALNEDATGNAFVLFPRSDSDVQNPLHREATLQLPGGDKSTLAWEVTADSAREEFVVIQSLQPLPDLDGQLAGWQQTVAADSATRAVGAIVNAPVPLLRGEHLQGILAKLRRDPAHVRVWQYAFAHRN
jgi:eukaryotic-like serine/threonine-protein kinase